jgi:hypothetical protein
MCLKPFKLGYQIQLPATLPTMIRSGAAFDVNPSVISAEVVTGSSALAALADGDRHCRTP